MSLVRSGFVTLPRGARPGFDDADVYPCPDSGGAAAYEERT